MRLYNTLSRSKEDFQPFNNKTVNMFVCGPTVYDYLHIGNGRTAITMDVLVRFLKHQGYVVNSIMNITDIDDKIIQRSQEQKIDWRQLTKKFEEQYIADMKNLDITHFSFVRATDHIKDIITQVQRLIDKKHAYKTDDGIYFEITTFKEYGKLSRRQDIKEDDAESRVDSSDKKRGWNDFCLWKFKKEGEPSWEAPFGEGRPGWHIEDTAITEHFFGPQYDIHGGGTDLMFPHHEAELTQMEAASGKVPFVKYWVHGAMLYTGGKRMGKSNKNFLTIHDVSQQYSAGAIRLMMLQAHYRSLLEFSEELLDQAAIRYKRWQNTAALRFQPSQAGDEDSAELLVRGKSDIIKVMGDDLNSPEAFRIIEEAFAVVENGIPEGSQPAFEDLLHVIDEIFGLNLYDQEDITEQQRELITKREAARANKDWKTSDDIRDALLKQHLAVRDTTQGTIWSRV